MTDETEIRRHADGSVDIDFYRARAHTLRRQAIRDAKMMPMASAGALVMAGALGFALVVPSAATAMRGQIAAIWPSLPLVR